jgi:hypothetical protein
LKQGICVDIDYGIFRIFRPSDLLDLKKQDAVLSSYDVILIDDAHERAVDLDLSLALLRHLLLQRQDLKLVLMTPLVKDGSLQVNASIAFYAKGSTA